VKLFRYVLFSLYGSGKPFHPNKQEQFTPEDVNSATYSRTKFTRFLQRENNR